MYNTCIVRGDNEGDSIYMNYQQAGTLEDRFKNHSWMKTASIIFLVIAAASAVFTLVMNFTNFSKKATYFNPLDTTEQYSYLDVVGISDWVASQGNKYYYAILDADGYYSVVCLKSSTVSKMTAQQTYWNDENASMPTPYRVYGMAEPAITDLESFTTDYFGLSDTDYDTYFGSMILNEYQTPFDALSSWSFFIALYCGILGASFLLGTRQGNKTARLCIDRIDALNLRDQAMLEMDTMGTPIDNKTDLTITDHFIYSQKSHVIVPFDDLIWVYKRVQRMYFFINVGGSIVANTKAIKNLNLYGFNGKGDKDPRVQYIFETIHAKNPSCMIGYTKEAQDAWKNMHTEPKKPVSGEGIEDVSFTQFTDVGSKKPDDQSSDDNG